MRRRAFLKHAFGAAAASAFEPLGPAPAFAQSGGSFIIPPYLQQPTPTSIIIRWSEFGTTPSPLEFKEWKTQQQAGNLEYGTAQNGDGIDVRVRVSNLRPDTEYSYHLPLFNEPLRWKTPPTIGSSEHFRVLVFGDVGYAGSTQNSVWSAARHIMATETALPKPHPQPFRFWLLLGDTAYGGPGVQDGTRDAFRRQFFDVFGSDPEWGLPRFPIWPAFGAHECFPDSFHRERSNYDCYDLFSLPGVGAQSALTGNDFFYSFDYANAHFVCLNSWLNPLDGGVSNAQHQMEDWLTRDLSGRLAKKAKWKIVFFHTPPYSGGCHPDPFNPDWSDIHMRNRIMPILDSFGVDLVLSGYNHVYERSNLISGQYESGTNVATEEWPVLVAGSAMFYRKTRKAGAICVVAGSSARPNSFRPQHPLMPYRHSRAGFMTLEVYGDTLCGKFYGSPVEARSSNACEVDVDMSFSATSLFDSFVVAKDSLCRPESSRQRP